MDEFARLIGYLALTTAALFVARLIANAWRDYWRMGGSRGILAFVLGFGGFAWMGYALTHKEDVGSAGLLIGLVAIWGTMIALMASMPTRKGTVPQLGGARATQPTATGDVDPAMDAYRQLTPEMVNEIVTRVGGYVGDRDGRACRASDLPYPAPLVERAFLKALREWPEGQRLELARSFYLSLDKWLLHDEEYELFEDHMAHLRRASTSTPDEVFAWATSERGRRAMETAQRVFDKADERNGIVEKTKAARTTSASSP